MKAELRAGYGQVPEGRIAFVEELPRANTQGATLDEARSSLQEGGAAGDEGHLGGALQPLTKTFLGMNQGVSSCGV